MKNVVLSFALFVLCQFFVWAVDDDKESFSLSLPPEIAEEFRSLFQEEKYAEAEALYLKASKEPDVNWITLLKMKQGKTEEGMKYLMKGISQAESPDERNAIIRRALGLVSAVSPELGIKFLDEFGKDLESDIDAICFRARYHMLHKEFDQAEKLVKDVLNQSSRLTGRNLMNAENTMGMMVAELYANGKNKEALKFFALLEEKYPKFRLDPGRQFLWSRIVTADGRGMEALKKIDWLIETFPDYCKQNPDTVLKDKARAYDSLGDITESQKLLEQYVDLARKNPKYKGALPIVEAKLLEYRQKEESVRQQRESWEAATKSPYELRPARLTVLRIFLVITGAVMICYAFYRLRNKQ